ncbi:prolipoprotein diacylglyceryl transferase [Nocardia flavorosea]|uniref:prolipoprotein diacylglyceryl transferase n=1 Tax=Nocardia flavorosea TaxID=53429 RepID=UPI000A4EE8CC|nr:prolipoprotein diacylglyceryl transferase [Nocardia flavorosea]
MTVLAVPETTSTAVSPATELLAYLPSPPQGVWDIGPFPLRAYAVCIIVGIIVAIWWGEKRWQSRGGEAGAILDVAVFAVPFGLIGGRIYHVATDWQKYFGADGNPVDALKIYQGGLGIWGAVFLGGIGAWIACRIYKIPLPALGDAIAPPILLAQAIGRLGNYFNQELYGRETDLPWGLEIYLRFDDAGRLDMMNGVSSGEVHSVVHPTFLYELLWNVAVVLALVYIDRRFRIGHGRLFALYVAGYCFGRFFVELMRDDEATLIAGIRVNSFTSGLVFLAAIAYVLFATKGRETPEQLRPGGGPRPWPWQFGALRAAGAATGPGSGDEDAAARESDTGTESAHYDAADPPAEAADSEDGGGSGATDPLAKPEGAAESAKTDEPADSAAGPQDSSAEPDSAGLGGSAESPKSATSEDAVDPKSGANESGAAHTDSVSSADTDSAATAPRNP